jgi:hypothetical protein
VLIGGGIFTNALGDSTLRSGKIADKQAIFAKLAADHTDVSKASETDSGFRFESQSVQGLNCFAAVYDSVISERS